MVKKSHLRQLSFILAMSVSLLSCTIQKRYFNRGYYIEWKSSFQKNETFIECKDTLSLEKKRHSKENIKNKSEINPKQIIIKLEQPFIKESNHEFQRKFHWKVKDSIKKKEFIYKNKSYVALKKDVDKLDELKYDKKEHFWIGISILILSLILFFITFSNGLFIITLLGISISTIGFILSLIFLLISLIITIKYKKYAENLISKSL